MGSNEFAWFQYLFLHLWGVSLLCASGWKAVLAEDASNFEPYFAETIPNVTIPVGRDVKLTCIVENLGYYRVAWLRVESKTILTIHHHVITRNYRIGLSYSDHRTWVLHIKNVQEVDRGGYMCQVNTVPMKSQVGFLDIVVPPEIVGPESSSDVLVREGSNVTLTCQAKGYPTPKITWRREDGQPIAVGNWQSNRVHGDTVVEGEELGIAKVSRLHMAAYLCIASNGVPPSVSRRMLLRVHFPPMIWIPNQLIGAPVSGEITLDCHTEAYPMSINYWAKEDGDMIASNEKYQTYSKESNYKVHMKLVIKEIDGYDLGTYKCFAKNSLGSTEGAIRLYEVHVAPSSVKEPSTAKIQSLNENGQHISHNTVFEDTVDGLYNSDLEDYAEKPVGPSSSKTSSSSIRLEQVSPFLWIAIATIWR